MTHPVTHTNETIMRPLAAIACVIALVIAAVSPASAKDPGEDAYTFLKIGTDARSEAMGGAMTGVADQLGATLYNPAALAAVGPRSVMASYTNWLTDIQAGALAAVWSVGGQGRIGISAQYLDYGDFDARDEVGNPGDDFSASDVALALTWANSVEGGGFGVSARFISESIADEVTGAIAVDFGMVFDLEDRRTRAGLALRNIGVQINTIEGGTKEEVSTTVALGLSHRLRGAPVLFAADLLKPSDDDVGGAFGVEVDVHRQFALRAGYNTLIAQIDTDSDSDNLAGISLGAGFSLERLAIDYAFTAYSELGDAHRFSIRSRF